MIKGLIWKFLIAFRCYFILVPLYVRVLRRYSEGGKNSRYSLFALNAGKFRGDLDVLGEQPEFSVVGITKEWESRISYYFYPAGSSGHEYYRAQKDPALKKCQDRCRKFLKGFLERLYKKVSIDAILMMNVRYLYDLDWAYVSREMGVPVIVLFREGLLLTKKRYKPPVERHKAFGRFQGDAFIVHNKAMRDLFLSTGFVSENEIHNCGVLRMDKYVARVKEAPIASKYPKKRIVLAYIRHDELTFSPGDPLACYDKIHGAFVELAKENPEVEFFLKPKDQDYLNLLEHFPKVLESRGLKMADLPNLVVDPSINIHNLVLNSDVICGMQTTVLLEAAIAGKAVVIPFFNMLAKLKSADYFLYQDYKDLFDIAKAPDDFKQIIMSSLDGYEVDPEMLSRRRAVFEEFVSSFSGTALDQYKEIILNSCQSGATSA